MLLSVPVLLSYLIVADFSPVLDSGLPQGMAPTLSWSWSSETGSHADLPLGKGSRRAHSRWWRYVGW